MSSVTELGTMAVNKLRYKLFKAAYDPEAEKVFSKENSSNKKKSDKKTNKDTKNTSSDGLTDTIKVMVNKYWPFKKKEEYENKPAGAQGRVPPKPPTPPADPAATFAASFTTTFMSFLGSVLLFFVCTTAGSMAANDAIGRSVAIRLVYFIYASIPLFSPFVLIYYAIRYFFLKTYPVWYNYLPITGYTSQYEFINTLLTPFFYLPDANTQYQHDLFVKRSEEFIWAGSAKGNNSNNNNGNNANGNNANGNNANGNNANGNNPNGNNANGNNPNSNNTNGNNTNGNNANGNNANGNNANGNNANGNNANGNNPNGNKPNGNNASGNNPNGNNANGNNANGNNPNGNKKEDQTPQSESPKRKTVVLNNNINVTPPSSVTSFSNTDNNISMEPTQVRKA